MTDEPNFHFDVTSVMAALDRGDYGWLVENVFNPALVQFIRQKHTNALINDSRPRTRRPAGTRHRTRRSHRFRP
jgi:hypothetical protein